MPCKASILSLFLFLGRFFTSQVSILDYRVAFFGMPSTILIQYQKNLVFLLWLSVDLIALAFKLFIKKQFGLLSPRLDIFHDIFSAECMYNVFVYILFKVPTLNFWVVLCAYIKSFQSVEEFGEFSSENISKKNI